MSHLTLKDFDPERLFVLPLGIGNAFTSRYFNASFIIFAEGRAILVDCPAPFRRVLREATTKAGIELGLEDIEYIILTHLHGDHCNGLEEVGFYKYFVLGEKRTNIYTLSRLIRPLWSKKLALSMSEVSAPESSGRVDVDIDTYFRMHGWNDRGVYGLAELGSTIEVQIRRTKHSVPCFGFFMRFGDLSIAYSADTPFEQEHIDFLAPADLIIHETGPSRNHSPLEKLAELPQEIRDKVVLIHLDDDFDESKSPIPALREGALYEVGAGREPIDPSRARR